MQAVNVTDPQPGIPAGLRPFPDCAAVHRWLEARPGERQRLRARVRTGLRESGLRLAPGNDSGSPEVSDWDVSLLPLVLGTDWDVLRAAVDQRARVANAFLRDIYGPREILRARIVPTPLVLGDPLYRRAVCGVRPGGPPAAVLRCDFVRGPAGWVDTGILANTPVGLGFTVLNRRALAQDAAPVFDPLPSFAAVSDVPLALLAALRAFAPEGIDDPNVVLLTAGPQDPFFGEHGFLARKMGVPLAQGNDLLVLDNRVYFRTVDGLEPVDVIYRRLNDAHIDPVVFPTRRDTAGIAGLVSCLRQGTVAVANAIGAGAAENRGLLAYWPALVRFYTGERPALATTPTLYCGDIDQLAAVAEDPERHRLLPVQDVIGAPGQGAEGLARVRQNPGRYVAQTLREPAPLPWWGDGPPQARPVRLSLFAICQQGRVDVLPGGFASFAGGDGAFPATIGDSADVVVLGSEPGLPLAPVRERELSLGSRAAENLYWTGRYAERADDTARMVALMKDVGLEEMAARDRERWQPLLRGLLEATGHAPRSVLTGVRGEIQASTMVLSSANPSSILSSLELVRDNVLRTRDYFSPESWRVVDRLCERVQALAREPTAEEAAGAGLGEAVAAVLEGIPCFLGTVDRTMPHDAGWRFLRIGLHIERAVITCAALRWVLGGMETAPREATPTALSALVRMLGSQDAFRRSYQGTPTVDTVLEFFLGNPTSPQSLEHGLASVEDHVAHLGSDPEDARSPAGRVRRLRSLLRTRPSPDGLPTELPGLGEAAAPRSLAEFFDLALEQLFALSDALGDHFLSHQARFGPEPCAVS